MWGDSETDRLLRRLLALQIMFALSGALVVAYLLWPPERDTERDIDGSPADRDTYLDSPDVLGDIPEMYRPATAEAADEFVRSKQVAW